jgi:hypothetical protein
MESSNILNVKNFLDFICDDFSRAPLYLPINTVSPSEELDGLRLRDERGFRLLACELIQEAGVLLRLPIVTVSTAQSLLHRFYFRKSFIRCEVFTVATAAVFIAAKVEENPRKVKDVISVMDYVKKVRENQGKKENVQLMDLNSFLFTDTKQEIIDAERYILKELGFATESLSKGNVHKYVFFYLRDILKGSKQLA